MENSEETKKDVSELRALLNMSKRQKVRNILKEELQKLTENLSDIGKNFRCRLPEKTIEDNGTKNYQIKVNSYAWDQTPKYVKFFVTLSGIRDSEPNIKCQFRTDSFELLVTNLNGKNYIFTVNKLLHSIKPDESFTKVKSNAIIIFAVKSEAIKWSHVTKLEKEFSDSKKRKYATEKTGKSDGSHLLSLMKNMYQKGDDRVKRTIAQAWTEVHSGKECF
ncbi:hypothetical protein WA026_012226 [Henosepilachna vigintioctopunctata]|uniref:Calcyclin-binding protein n=1 Tax=Henosepilachna vigintioctopunctata TaxID=420089 RepID=A0AAW1VFP7_9CUCU